MIKRLSFALAVGFFAFAGCRSDDRATGPSGTPTAPAPATPAPPEAVGGGPVASTGSSREGTIDRLSHARCQARERCGNVGVLRDHASYSECVEVARAELRGSFGAPTCTAYDEDKLDGCVRKVAEAPCGTENKLSDECVEAALCRK